MDIYSYYFRHCSNFCGIFFLSQQMFNKQINIWNKIAPQQILTNLMDSDYFAIEREIDFLNSTELFSSFVVLDNKKKTIAYFSRENIKDEHLIPIQDDAKVTWGYFYFKPDFNHFISPFLIAAGIFFLVVMFLYFIIRWRIRISLETEFKKFNKFLDEIENITERLPEIYNLELSFDFKLSQNSEQLIINKAISKLMNEIKKSNKSLREAISATEQRRFQEELTRTALQVAHDIASPIAVLGIVESTANTLPEDSRYLIRRAIANIRNISNTLLKKSKKDSSSISGLVKQSLQSLIEQSVAEKSVQYANHVRLFFDCSEDAYKIFSLINPVELNRVLSNLINNSVEAMENDNQINISLSKLNNEALIKIQDYGKGISSGILTNLGKFGKSFGKSQGTGIGLNHAINAIDEWKGRFDIQSKIGEGATVKIFLPMCEPPSWFFSEINLEDKKTIVIIDDDESIHAIWKKRFEQYEDMEIIHFNLPDQLIRWFEMNRNQNILYLCDYEFVGSSINGIELIKKLKINHVSVLITNKCINEIIIQCEAENIKILPKNLAGVISIVNPKILMSN